MDSIPLEEKTNTHQHQSNAPSVVSFHYSDDSGEYKVNNDENQPFASTMSSIQHNDKLPFVTGTMSIDLLSPTIPMAQTPQSTSILNDTNIHVPNTATLPCMPPTHIRERSTSEAIMNRSQQYNNIQSYHNLPASIYSRKSSISDQSLPLPSFRERQSSLTSLTPVHIQPNTHTPNNNNRLVKRGSNRLRGMAPAPLSPTPKIQFDQSSVIPQSPASASVTQLPNVPPPTPMTPYIPGSPPSTPMPDCNVQMKHTQAASIVANELLHHDKYSQLQQPLPSPESNDTTHDNQIITAVVNELNNSFEPLSPPVAVKLYSNPNTINASSRLTSGDVRIVNNAIDTSESLNRSNNSTNNNNSNNNNMNNSVDTLNTNMSELDVQRVNDERATVTIVPTSSSLLTTTGQLYIMQKRESGDIKNTLYDIQYNIPQSPAQSNLCLPVACSTVDVTPSSRRTSPTSSVTHVSRQHHSTWDASTKKFVGLPAGWAELLQQQFGISPQQCECIDLRPKYKSKIPLVLIELQSQLHTNNGYIQEGIFRLAPDATESIRVKQLLNTGTFNQQLTTTDMNVIANLIKVWYRDLPCKIFDTLPDRTVLIKPQYNDELMHNLIQLFTEPYQSLLLWLLDLCCDITQYSTINKMTSKNLAIVIAPNLYTFHQSGIDNDEMQRNLTQVKQYNIFFESAINWRNSTRIVDTNDKNILNNKTL